VGSAAGGSVAIGALPSDELALGRADPGRDSFTLVVGLAAEQPDTSTTAAATASGLAILIPL
jgi:hypothetical protein